MAEHWKGMNIQYYLTNRNNFNRKGMLVIVRVIVNIMGYQLLRSFIPNKTKINGTKLSENLKVGSKTSQ